MLDSSDLWDFETLISMCKIKSRKYAKNFRVKSQFFFIFFSEHTFLHLFILKVSPNCLGEFQTLDCQVFKKKKGGLQQYKSQKNLIWMFKTHFLCYGVQQFVTSFKYPHAIRNLWSIIQFPFEFYWLLFHFFRVCCYCTVPISFY